MDEDFITEDGAQGRYEKFDTATYLFSSETMPKEVLAESTIISLLTPSLRRNTKFLFTCPRGLNCKPVEIENSGQSAFN